MDFGSSIIEKARHAFDAPILSNMIVQEIKWFEPERYARFVSEFGKVMSGHNDYNAEFMAGLERGLAKEA